MIKTKSQISLDISIILINVTHYTWLEKLTNFFHLFLDFIKSKLIKGFVMIFFIMLAKLFNNLLLLAGSYNLINYTIDKIYLSSIN